MLKKSLILLWGLMFCACTSQKQKSYTISKSNPIKDSIMFEKFDFELHATNYAGYERVHNSRELYGSNGFYKLKNGGAFNPFNGGYPAIYYSVIPPSPYFYSYWYEYFQNGNLKEYGKLAGFGGGVQIGIWKYYDETGKMTEVDEDKKFGLWPFEKMLEKLDKDEVIDLATGKNREANRLHFHFTTEKKEWRVKVFRKKKNELVEEYWEYLFDGNTGEYSREWYEEYNEKIRGNMGEGLPMPPLKNSKKNKQNKQKNSSSIYKTHEGKDYTRTEWEEFEERQYEDYCKRTGRTYMAKNQESRTKNQDTIDKNQEEGNNRSSFLADGGEKGDDNSPKKKGFLGGLFG